MGLARIFGFGLALLFASSVAASTIDVGPSNWRNYGPNGTHTSGGVQSTFGQSVRLPPTISGPTRVLPVSRNPVIPYGSIANGAKNFLRVNPQSVAASAAITGLFLAVDWVFDQATGEWVKEEFDITDEIVGDFFWTISGPTQFASAESACEAYPAMSTCNRCVPGSGSIDRFEQPGLAVCGYQYEDWSGVHDATIYTSRTGGNSCPDGYIYYPAVGGCGAMIARPISEADWAELEASLPSSNPQEVANAGRDSQNRLGGPLPGYTDMPMTGPSSVTGPETTSTSTDPVTGDTIVTNTSTQTNISYGPTTITTTNTTTSTTYQNGQETGTTVTTETPGELPVDSGGGGASGDWPGFCDWATVVCDWLDWTREDPPPEQDLPQLIDDDFFEEKQISFGAKSCPEPYAISLAPFMDTTVGVSFQPLCDFAGLIYYMVMAASYIIAAYISIGVARNA